MNDSNFTPKQNQTNKNSAKSQNLTRKQYRKQAEQENKTNVWDLAIDRPYIAVAVVVLGLLFIMTKWWLGLGILFLLVIIGIVIISYSKTPSKTLSIEFKLGGSRKLNALKALQFGAAMIMFLATYMRQVVVINFQITGAQDSLKVIQGAAAQTNNTYATQGANALGILDNLMNGSLWGTYRYATNSAQFMSDPNGKWIMIWTFLLMLAPAFCVIGQFFREPYSRRTMLVCSGLSVVLFILTPSLIIHWGTLYGINHQMNQEQIHQMFSIGYMAYPAILCAVLVFIIALYRSIKRDNFH
ncbi:cytochrome C5 [Lactobacillus sp. PV034]|uniref:cytochrome C5 n=1 Tax=Lactobacillus sp. PV034 TaxID=2594495 RepID=UPI00223F72EA|nr:cytochrome C5 [Lactobacillus sp. PV034]QNQ81235.1 cytochrome C5 [Lactobacillus sp. PV034]